MVTVTRAGWAEAGLGTGWAGTEAAEEVGSFMTVVLNGTAVTSSCLVAGASLGVVGLTSLILFEQQESLYFYLDFKL